MELNVPLFNRLIAPATELVDEAGRQVMAVYERARIDKRDLDLQTKSDDSPVTAADLAAHRVLDAGLPALLPDVPVVSEENAESHQRRSNPGTFWLIDPVDGTREFIARTDEFTVNVALIHDGRPLMGIVLAPALNKLYWGGKSWGAWRRVADDVQSIRVAEFPSRNANNLFERALRVVASRHHMNDATTAHLKPLQPQALVRAGSSLKFCLIAEGLADYYPRLGPTSEWDTAAAQAVVEGANGKVTDLSGVPLHYGRRDILNPHFIVSAQGDSTA